MSIRPHHTFFVLMTLASAISLLKSGVLAAVLSPTDFTHYSAAFALVGLAASSISFGLTEGMVKKFTRLIAFGRVSEMRSALGVDVRILLRRHLVTLVIFPAASWILFGPEVAFATAAVLGLACATNLFAIAASIFRAYDRLLGLGVSAMSRAVCALILSSAGAVLIGWRAGLAAEAISATLIAAAFLYFLRRVLRADANSPRVAQPDEARFVSDKNDGLWLFMAFCVALIPMSIDRLWVTRFASPVDAAQYAFCGIWITAAYTVTSIYAQKFGPDMIRLQATRAPHGLLAISLRHMTILGGIVAGGAAASFVLIYMLWPELYWRKYDLSVAVALATLAVVSIQVSSLLDWVLIALNGERYAFAAALAFAITVILLFAICAYFGGGFLAYMASIGLARLLQIILSATWIARIERQPQNTTIVAI